MPIEVMVDQLLGGYTLKTVKEGQEATLIIREFVSSDNELFESRVTEGIPHILLSRIPLEDAKRLLPVTSMLAILRGDTTATLYLETIPDDPKPVMRVRPKSAVKSGEPVEYENIADIIKVEYPGVTFPKDAGIAAVFSSGGQRGFFYDLAPLHGDKEPRQFDVEKALASFFCYLQQKHLFELDEDDWKYLFDNQWFPFITLKSETRKLICEQAKARLPIDNMLSVIAEETVAGSGVLREKIHTHSIFSAHADLLNHALDEYLKGDYISSTSIIFPRIEGVLRSICSLNGGSTGVTQSSMSEATILARGSADSSGILLLPAGFVKYLTDVC